MAKSYISTMLYNIFANQITPSIFNKTEINECYIKFDTPIENISEYSGYTFSDFDVKFAFPQSYVTTKEKNFNKNSILSNDSITINYNFSNDGLFDYNNEIYDPEDFSMFVGKKITDIGFGENNTCLAIVDVSNMNIIINENETLEIYRTDTYQSDAKCVGFDFPLHLVNNNAKYNAIAEDSVYKVAKLYSIGLGNKEGYMESENVININDEILGDNYITIDFSETIKVGHYPSETLFPGFYPTMDNSKYLILKYRLCTINNVNQLTELDEYYTMSYKNDLSQYNDQEKNISFTLKIERS